MDLKGSLSAGFRRAKAAVKPVANVAGQVLKGVAPLAKYVAPLLPAIETEAIEIGTVTIPEIVIPAEAIVAAGTFAIHEINKRKKSHQKNQINKTKESPPPCR